MTQSYSKKKSLMGKENLNYIKLLINCWHDIPNNSMLQNTRKIVNFSSTYEKAYKTDSLQPSGCNEPLAYIYIHINIYIIHI